MKFLIRISIIALLVVSCNKSDDNDDVTTDDFSVIASVDELTISSLIDDDEVVEIEFVLDDPSQTFSYMEISWEFDNSSLIESEDDLVFASQFDVTVPESSFDGNKMYRYSILERSLYTKFPSDIFEIQDGLELKLQWDAYDINDNLLASNHGKEIVVTVSCSPEDSFLSGRYILTSEVVWDAVFPRSYLFTQDTIDVLVGENPSERVLQVQFVALDLDLIVYLDCEGLSVPLELNSDGGITCGDDSVVFASEVINPIDYSDDSLVVFEFITDYHDACGVRYDETITLTKVE